MADDPTYPFRPIVALFCAACLLYMLTMNILRQSWNLGVLFLCFWMFFDNVTSGANAVVWADNADIRAHVYCDIVSHLRVFVAVVRPACTLILTRRLYKIASLRSFDAENPLERRFDLVFEWGLGAVLPTIVTGVFYYIVQDARFQVIGSIGCFDTFSSSGLSLILVEGWTILFPAISVFFYCPRIFYVFYHHSQATRRILQSTHVTSNKIYLRLLAIGSLDIAITLPIGIVNVITTVKDVDSFPFYVGWTAQHSNWAPYSVTYAEVLSAGFWDKFEFYFEIWTTPVLSIAIIAIFGLTADGGSMWRRGVRFVKEFAARAGMVRAPAKTQLSDLHFHHTTGLPSLTELGAASTSTDVMRVSIPLHTFASDPESKAIIKD